MHDYDDDCPACRERLQQFRVRARLKARLHAFKLGNSDTSSTPRTANVKVSLENQTEFTVVEGGMYRATRRRISRYGRTSAEASANLERVLRGLP